MIYSQFLTSPVPPLRVNRWCGVISRTIFSDCDMSCSNIQLFCKRMAITIQYLITIRSVGNHFHCFCCNTVIRGHVLLSSSSDSKIYNLVQPFLKRVFNQYVLYCAYETQSKKAKQNRVMLVWSFGSKLEITIPHRLVMSAPFSTNIWIKTPISCLQTFKFLKTGR